MPKRADPDLTLYKREPPYSLLLNWAGWETKEVCLSHYRRTHPRRTEDFDLIFVEEGRGEMVIGETVFALARGELLLIHPGEVFDVHFFKEEFTRYFIHFDVLPPVSGQRPGDDWDLLARRRLETPDFRTTHYLCSQVLNEWIRTDSYWRQRGGAYLTELLVSLHRETRHLQASRNVPRLKKNLHKIRRARRFIEDNVKEKPELDEMAAVAGLNKDYFSKVFRECVGYSPYAYLTKCRINSARNTPIKSDLPIKLIAEKTGFNDPQQFTRVFKKLTDTTPARFRHG